MLDFHHHPVIILQSNPEVKMRALRMIPGIIQQHRFHLKGARMKNKAC